MHKISLVSAVIIAHIIYNTCAFSQSPPLPNAFAHNDYWHQRPLYDALENGYTNIEADVFLRRGDLVVAHINPYFKAHRKLEELYLKPLLHRVARNNGMIYLNYPVPITLLIDIKSDANETYKALKQLLEKYRSILTSYNNGVVTPRAVTIVLSGNKPYDMVKSESSRFVFIDKDLREETTTDLNANVYTMASCKYSKLIKWNGYGSFPKSQKENLIHYVKLAHSRGEKVRLWASPDNATVWNELLKCGVDLINTNQLVALKKFLISTSRIIREDLPGLPQPRYAAVN
jgi:hypothetical protein